jgi:hypothetical protein
MATNVKYNCVETYSKSNSWNFKEYDTNCVIWRGTDTKTYFSLNQNGSFKRIKNGEQTYTGTWICDGNSNFILMGTNATYYSSDGFKKRDKVNQPISTIDPIFSCIQPHFDNEGRKLTTQSNGSITVFTKDRTAVWVFTKNKKWSQYNPKNKKIEFTGKWECTGNSSFRIISDDNQEWLSSDSLGWTDIQPPSENPPKTDGFQWKDTTLTIEDLKSGKTVSMGMRGAVIGEIQKLLINKGYKNISKSGEPDNLFGSLTKAQVEKFQSENKNDKGEQLKKDGIVGQETINALLKTTPNTKGLETAVKAYVPKVLRTSSKEIGQTPKTPREKNPLINLPDRNAIQLPNVPGVQTKR